MPEISLNYEYITTDSGLDRVLSWCSDRKFFTVDSEGTGLDPLNSKIVLVQIGDDEKQWVIDARTTNIKRLGPVFSDPEIIKLGQNIRHDIQMFMHHYGITFNRVVCTMIAEQVIRCGLFVTSNMKDLAERYLGININKDMGLRTSFSDTQVGEFTKEQLDYAAGDCVYPVHIIRKQRSLLRERGLLSTFELENEFIPVLAEMELSGMYLDTLEWKKVYQSSVAKVIEYEQVLDKLFGVEISEQDTLFGEKDVKRSLNYNSPSQIKKALRTKGFDLKSTNAGILVLEAIEGRIPKDLVQAILNYRVFNTAKTRYGLNFLEAIHPETNRVYSSFSQCWTETGRLSSGESTKQEDSMGMKRVNFQNIPSDARFRHCFKPQAGNVFIIYDYQAIEPRILGEMSEDPTYLETFAKNGDIYSEVGTKIYGEEVSKKKGKPRELRDKTKVVVLGNSYGTGKEKFHKKLLVDFNMDGDTLKSVINHISREESDNLYDRFFEICPKIKECLDNLSVLANPIKSNRRVYDEIAAAEDYATIYAKVEEGLARWGRYSEKEIKDIARKTTNRRGYITFAEDLGGRKRFFKVFSSNTYTEGRNGPIQQSAATILKRAMVDLYRKIKSTGHNAKIINQVHDEIIVECKEEEAEEVNAYTKPILEAAGMKYFKKVNCRVEGGIKTRWEKE